MLALGSLVVLVLALLALVTGVGTGGSLDPRSYEPEGARALATLLQDQDVQVVRTEDVPTTVAGVDRRTTVFVPQPQLLSTAELTVLAGSGAQLVIVGADPSVIEALGLDTDVLDVADVSVRDPRCDLEVATRAGRALTGGVSYRAEGGCYPAGGGSSLVRYGGVVALDGGPRAAF